MKHMILLAALALPGCAEKMVAIEADASTVSGAPFRVRAGPAALETVRLTIAPKFAGPSEAPWLYAKPAEATLKVAGFVPVRAEEVTEAEDSYTLQFRLLPETVKALDASHPTERIYAQLVIPTETGLGKPGSTTVGVALAAQRTGTMKKLLAPVTDFLRSLYSAR